MKRLVAILVVLALTLLPDVASAQDSIFDFPAGGTARQRSPARSSWGYFNWRPGFGDQQTGWGYDSESGNFSVTRIGNNYWYWNYGGGNSESQSSTFVPRWSQGNDYLEQMMELEALQEARRARQDAWLRYYMDRSRDD